MKTFVIGDIHGAHKALVQCLDRSGFEYENDTLISLGDIADGWSEVPECVEELLKIKNLIPIRGNHDVWCRNWFTNGDIPDLWTQQGGVATINAYEESGKIACKIHRDFWDNQVDWYIDEKNSLFVHAGFDLYDGFEASKKSSPYLWGASTMQWTRKLADLRAPSEAELVNLNQFKEIFIGHTPHNGNKFNKYNIWNLDTGAGYDGVLTMMNVDTNEFFQSDNVKVLYKEEKGRA